MRTFKIALVTFFLFSLFTALFVHLVGMPILVNAYKVRTVPRAIDLSYYQAVEVLEKAGFSHKIKGESVSISKYSKVIRQDPPPLMKVKRRREVFLWVSSE